MSTPPQPPLRIAPIIAPTLASVRPLPPATTPALEPYRVLFPLGAACAIAGALPWVARPFGVGAWPGALHSALTLEGFELAFVTGFLLSSLPAFTHGARCRPWELALTAAGVALFATLRSLDFEVAAYALFAATLAFVAIALARRTRLGGPGAPAEEFALVALGLLLGIAGGVLQSLAAAGLFYEPVPRLALRLVARGMMLALVLGLGGLLVPTFAGTPEPLRIVGIARAGQRGPRRAFVATLALLIVGALAAEATAHPAWGAWLRLAAAAASTLLAWKLWRLPPRPDRLPWALWAAGVCVLAGLLLAALWPAHEIAAWHVVFVGGYGLLTLAIGTRVVVSHGGHAFADEARVLGVPVLACVALALATRLVGGEFDPRLAPLLAVAGALWALAWALWLAGALPRMLRTRRGDLMIPTAPAKR